MPTSEARRQEEVILADLAKLCATPGYVHALAHLCFRDNIVAFSGEMKPEDMRKLFSDSHLIRTEIMTLVGFLTRNEIDYKVPPPATLGECVERTDALLQELHNSMSARIIADFDPAQASDPNFNPFDSGDALREPIFYGGESAYIFQYRELARKKYASDNEWLKAHRGFLIADAVDVVHAISRLQDKKVMATVRALRTKPPEEWTVLPGFSFSADEVAKEAHLDVRLVQRVIDAFASPVGEKNEHFNALNDFNVANAFPLVRKEPDEFVLFHQYGLAEALYEAPFYWMAADKDYASISMKNRGRFTEEFSCERLERVFGKEKVFANVDIVDSKGNKAGEIDGLVVFGNRAIVLQAKSKRLTLEARRGNDGQIRDDFKKSIQDSYDQGFTCARCLTDRSYRLVMGGKEIVVTRDFEEIYIFCVICDHYPALAFQARQFLKYKTDAIIQPPFVMDVFTLDAMTEMLESPLRLLSYVSQRTKYSERLMSPHELTILSYHLKRNLWLDDKHDMVVLHDDISTDLDLAMAVRRDGIPGRDTPDGILTRLTGTVVGQIVQQIESKAEPGLIDFGFLLLTLSEEAASNISRGIESIVKQTLQDGKLHDLTVPMGHNATGLTVHSSLEPNEIARARLHSHCERRKYIHKADTWYGICVCAGDQPLRFGITLKYPWTQSDRMDMVAGELPRKQPIRLSKGGMRKKIGRNDLCPCGSSLKYKRCCLQ